jgi:hypothetical protein
MSLLYGSSWFAFYEHFYFEIETAMYTRLVYSERQKYGINSLKIKQNFFQKNLWTGQF